MARKQLYITLRGGVYQLRVRVHGDLRETVGKTEITKSLRTGDLKEAQQRARIERVKLDADWTGLRRRLSPKKVETLSEAETWNLVAKWFIEAERKNAEQLDAPSDKQRAEIDLTALSDWNVAGASVFKAAKELLADSGLAIDENSPSFLPLQKLLHRAMVETERRQVARHFRDTPIAPDAEFAALSKQTALQPVSKNTLSLLMEAVVDDHTKTKPNGKTAVKREGHWSVLKEFFGAETDLKAITRQRVREFMALLERLPSNASKHFPDKTVFEAVDLGGKMPKLTPETANGYMRAFGSLMRYALHEGLLDADPSVGLIFKKSKVKNKDKRLPFDIEDLKAVFAAPIYTGCKDDGFGYNKPGSNVIRRGRFWVPLIGLYTGMRLNEICQLTNDDFVQEEGVDIIHIRESDDDDDIKRVKTDAGVRFVPVHPELRKLGLLNYVEERRKADGPNAPVFPDLPIGTTGYRSDPFSKWFANFLDHVGVKHAKKVFHSFRHNYRDALRHAKIHIEIVRALGGWSTGKTEDDYGKGFTPAELLDAIEGVKYDGLDLSHLYVVKEDQRDAA